MNCKPQELAVVVRTRRGVQVGKIVRCVQHVRFSFVELGVVDAWITEPMLLSGSCPTPCPDAWLRPIRPDGVTEEEANSLYLAPPHKEKANA